LALVFADNTLIAYLGLSFAIMIGVFTAWELSSLLGLVGLSLLNSSAGEPWKQ